MRTMSMTQRMMRTMLTLSEGQGAVTSVKAVDVLAALAKLPDTRPSSVASEGGPIPLLATLMMIKMIPKSALLMSLQSVKIHSLDL